MAIELVSCEVCGAACHPVIISTSGGFRCGLHLPEESGTMIAHPSFPRLVKVEDAARGQEE